MDYYIYFCGIVATFGLFYFVGTIKNKANLFGAILMSIFFPITVPIVLFFAFVKNLKKQKGDVNVD